MRKTQLLQETLKFENVRKSYSFKTKFIEFASKIETFKNIQKSLFTSTYLIHFDNKRQLYIDLDFNKEMNIDEIIYHVTDNENFLNYFFRKSIQSIMFLSRFLSSIEIKY